MPKTMNLAFKVPLEIHQKIKVMSAISGKSMSDIIIDFIQKQEVIVPEFTEPGKPMKVKSRKAPKTKTAKPGKTARRKDINPEADEELIKVEITKHKAAGLSLQQISDQLEADGVKTLRGGKWQKGTVDGFLRKWGMK